MGVLGLSLSDLDRLTPGEVIAALEAKKEYDRTGWEQVRMVMWAALVPHQQKNSKLKPTDVLSFPWDGEAAVRNLPPPETAEQAAARRALHQAWDEKMKLKHQNLTNGKG